MTTKIKICGITSLQDALAALDAGADFLGLIFAQSSPRRADHAVAKEIIAGVEKRAKVVGVFKDQPLDEVRSLAQKLGLDFVQCHGAESIEYVRQLPAKVIKVLELTGAVDSSIADTAQTWKNDAAYLLFDRPKSLSDPAWYKAAVQQLLAAQRSTRGVDPTLGSLPLPYFFAGGLSAENVGEIVASLQPFAVDVASSIESSPGKKDIAKMNDFCKAVKRDCQVI